MFTEEEKSAEVQEMARVGRRLTAIDVLLRLHISGEEKLTADEADDLTRQKEVYLRQARRLWIARRKRREEEGYA